MSQPTTRSGGENEIAEVHILDVSVEGIHGQFNRHTAGAGTSLLSGSPSHEAPRGNASANGAGDEGYTADVRGINPYRNSDRRSTGKRVVTGHDGTGLPACVDDEGISRLMDTDAN